MSESARQKKKLIAVPGIPYLKLNEVTGIYYVRISRAGKGELLESTHERSKMRAKTIAERRVSEFIGDTRKSTTRRKTVSTILDELEVVLEEEFQNKDRRAKTRAHDKDFIKVIRKYFGTFYVDEIDEDFWENWVRRVGRKLDRTLFDVAKYLSKTLTFAYRRKYINRKPVIANPDPDRKTGRAYTDEEIAALVKAADPKTLSQITLGYECGLRSYEVRCLRKDWIKFNGPGIAILSLPTDFVKANARTIQLSPGASKLVWEIVQEDKTGSPFVYPSPTNPLYRCETPVYQNRRWREIVFKSKLTGRVWFRYLRQTFYNKVLLELGLPVQNVSEYGGTSIKTLQKNYTLQDPKRTALVGQALEVPTGRKKTIKGSEG